MKLNKLAKIAAALCLLGAPPLQAQFNSGSTGADGALNVTSNTTLNLPPDGVFNFTTINVDLGATLSFNRNALNTPVYLLATSNVAVSGIINVSGGGRSGKSPGRGGPGGFDGGFGDFQGFLAGDGQGPGAGRVGQSDVGGVYAYANVGNTNMYGNTLLSPLIGGSGGGSVETAADGGGGGGGAILIASSTSVRINGQISANGGIGYGGGSGGAVRVVAPVIDGVGTLNVSGANSSTGGTHNGGPGRTRLDCTDRFSHRNIVLGGKGTRGSQMFVFPPNNPRLDIIEAAGTVIPVGTNAPVAISLPLGSSTNQIVRIQATGFTNDQPITVAITPENAPSARFFGVITNTGNPSVGQVTVTLPVDTVCHLHVWTR